MSETGWATLRQVLLSGYGDLTRRLAAKLGSRELAQDALHDTYLRLERGGELEPVRRPEAFLMRMALNSASNRRRSEARMIPSSEGRALLDAIDEQPDPEQVALARSDIERLRAALEELPPRRRQIFLAAWGEGAPQRDIAERFGVAVRTVKLEIMLARQHCADRLGFEGKKILPFPSRRLSSEDEGRHFGGHELTAPKEADEI